MDQNTMSGARSMKGTLPCLVAILAVSLGGTAIAQTEGVYRAGAERIAASDDIRRLSQEIAAAACLADAGVDTATHMATLTNAIGEYDALFAALSEGDATRGIDQPEEDRKMNVALSRVQTLWDNYKPAIDARINGTADPSGLDYISRQNLNVMHSGKYLVSEVINRYSVPPALLSTDAFTLDIVARQRSLAFQIAKEACGVITGNTVLGKQARLAKASQRFDVSLNALINGFPGAGVVPAPTAAIRDGLTAVQGDWNRVQTMIDQIGGPGDVQVASDIHDRMSSIATAFDALVPLYVEESKAGIN
ncbi:type IV pili methyl-accepting chemotaxis transducer N-terminal domain-containing protein [Yoonia sp. 2307UL14-13]|uniref:type IV pili methyl-accepting chemotaxis transducer N-terminal domain-containing protein n=1 Tax=Yoonia sp. 2307UL14-13 TaxID=3126506 RepID=UPI0030A21D3C